MKKRCFAMMTAVLIFAMMFSMLTGCGSASATAASTAAAAAGSTGAAGAASAAEAQSGAGAETEAGTNPGTAGAPNENDSGTTAGNAAAPAAADGQTASASTAEPTGAASVNTAADTVQDAPVAAAAEALTTEQIAEYVQTSYNDLASAIMLGMQDGWQSVTTDSLGISEIYAAYPENAFGFSIQDINGDGIPEMLIGETVDNDASSPLYDIFTGNASGDLVHVFAGGERNRCFLYENGTLANLSSSGADDSSFIHYVLEDGILVADDSGENGGNYVDITFTYFIAS